MTRFDQAKKDRAILETLSLHHSRSMLGGLFSKGDYFVLTLYSQIVCSGLSGNTHKIIKLEKGLCLLLPK